MSTSDAVALMVASGMITVVILLALLVYVLTVIAYWKMFTKAGEAGWKSIIPFLNVYTLYKMTWASKFFYVWLGLNVVSIVCSNIADNSAASVIGGLVGLGLFVLHILSCSKLSKAYGKGTGTTVGLIFLNTIFILILGFGDAAYVGPDGQPAQQNTQG